MKLLPIIALICCAAMLPPMPKKPVKRVVPITKGMAAAAQLAAIKPKMVIVPVPHTNHIVLAWDFPYTNWTTVQFVIVASPYPSGPFTVIGLTTNHTFERWTTNRKEFYNVGSLVP